MNDETLYRQMQTEQQLREIGIGGDVQAEDIERVQAGVSDHWRLVLVTTPARKPGMKPSTIKNALVITALIWVPVLVYLWRTR